MSMSTRDDTAPPQQTAARHAEKAPAEAPRRRRSLGLDRFSGLYVLAALIVLFGLWVPDLFLTSSNVLIIAGDQAITAMLALGLAVPLAARVFDLSIAGTLGLSVAIVIWMQSQGYPPWLAVVVTVLAGTLVGLVNGLVVVKLRVDSLIATLGMSSILMAGAFWVTGGQQIVSGISPSFLTLGTGMPLGLPLPVYFMATIAAVLWYVLEYTPVGRYLYAIGGNPEAARLAGVHVDRTTWGSLAVSGTVAAFAGVILAAKLGSANPTVGPSYLLPAFAAVFLGATQIKAGRVNVPGTLVAIFLLATGVKGLQLAGAPAYVNDLFNGLALIVAVALAARTMHRK